MDIHKNEKNELRLWAKDDIVPGDLQELCKQAATSITKLQKRIKELERVLDNIRLTSGASYKLPVTAEAAMKNMRIINRTAEKTLKG